MDANHPSIYIYGDSSEGTTSRDAMVRIAYGKERKDADKSQDSDWTCVICNINNFATRLRCFRCQNPRPDPASVVKVSNTGDNDVASDKIPSQFILLRGLEASVTEELLGKGVAKLNKPSSSDAQNSSTVKKAKVASTTGDANLGAKDGTLRRVLLVRDRKTTESWRYGFAEYATIEDAQAALKRYNSFDRFTIASKQVLASYIHAGVFVPVLNPTEANEHFTFAPIGNSAVKLQYWDEEAYVTERVISLPPPDLTMSASSAQPLDKEKQKMTVDLDKLKKRKQQLEAANSSKKATPSHLQFWSNRHAELHGTQADKSERKDGDADVDVIPPKSFADPNRVCCWLCMRRFYTMAGVERHERESDMHRENLKDEAKVARGEHKLRKHGITVATQSVAAVPTGEVEDNRLEYRDRAKERRRIYGVVNKKGEVVGTPAKQRSPSPEPAAPSKGANLLAKMGYTSGSGLGVSGTGMTAPLAQNVYAAGVGLGAQGGNLGDAVEQAERNTKGDYGDWVAQGRDKMRERYKEM